MDTHQQTDLIIAKMQKWLLPIYLALEKQIGKELAKFAKTLQEKSGEILKEYEAAETLEEKRNAKNRYFMFFVKTLESKEFLEISRKISHELYLVNVKASDYINSNLPAIYTMNFNAMGNSLGEALENYDFVPAEEEEVEEYGELTMQEIDQGKDEKWNSKNLAGAVTAGAFAMMPIKKIFADTAQKITQKNYNSSAAHAQDMATDSENKGRLDTMYRAQDFGFDIEKKWNSTKDNKTRKSHRRLDGKVLPLDKDFLPGLSQPRDPHGEPDEISRCRCWLSYAIKGISQNPAKMAARIGKVKGRVTEFESFRGTRTVVVRNMTYTEWAKSRSKK